MTYHSKLTSGDLSGSLSLLQEFINVSCARSVITALTWFLLFDVSLVGDVMWVRELQVTSSLDELRFYWWSHPRWPAATPSSSPPKDQNQPDTAPSSFPLRILAWSDQHQVGVRLSRDTCWALCLPICTDLLWLAGCAVTWRPLKTPN